MEIAVSCNHPKNSMVWVKEGAFSGVCKCTSCGEEFNVQGWATRGSGEAAKDGLISGAIKGFLSKL